MHPKHPDYLQQRTCKIDDAWPIAMRDSTPLVPHVMNVRDAPVATWIVFAGDGWAVDVLGQIATFGTAGDAVEFALRAWPTSGVKVSRR